MMLWGLLWTLFFSGLQAAAQSKEEKYVLQEGETLTVDCPSNRKYAYSQKAWQRLRNGEEPQTLAVTERSQGTLNQIQVGRYILRDDPAESMFQVRMINLQVEDSGLYRCVVYYPPPKEPVLLFHPVRLVVTVDPSTKRTSDKNSTPKLAPTTIRPTTLPTTKTLRTFYTSSRTVVQSLPMSTAVIPPNTTVNPTDAISSPSSCLGQRSDEERKIPGSLCSALSFLWPVESSLRAWSSLSCLLSLRGHLDSRPRNPRQ
ncbi:triggering receptor expressed on myeloid cells 1 isoform X1 [Marmota flaviventris]|uniref:triggering receptor expressed on myeloid cells 1 isoform X1 n=1 Tax=Marmota flaviventris TaxID=93162 RepID=UPI000FFF85AB|nr:triggering receptor expressed on myeloid cells 1 isoform X1 [Marmota flaviventris]